MHVLHIQANYMDGKKHALITSGYGISILKIDFFKLVLNYKQCFFSIFKIYKYQVTTLSYKRVLALFEMYF